jgi:hypothetical protein
MGAFHRELERFAERVWESEYALQCDGRPELSKIRPTRDRGILFMAVESKIIFFLGIGKQSNLSPSTSKFITGDPGNASASFVEGYYDRKYSIDELSVLATHAVVQAARFNFMVSGLHALAWREGDTDAQWLDNVEYQARSQKLERKLLAVIETDMASLPLKILSFPP